MKKIRLNSIRMKIVLWTGACLLLATAVIIVYAAVSLRRSAMSLAEDSWRSAGKAQAEKIKAELETALIQSRGLAGALSVVKSPTHPAVLERYQVTAMLFPVIDQNKNFAGIYTSWEPNAFDGRDAEYANTNGHEKSGRFIPYWYRDEKGVVRFDASPKDQEQEIADGVYDYYLKPKQSKQETVMSPYTWAQDGKNTLLVSFVVPVMESGQFLGIVGIDYSMQTVQKWVEEFDPGSNQVELELVTNDGILGGSSLHDGEAGKKIAEVHKDIDLVQLMQRIDKGAVDSLKVGNSLEILVPFALGNSGTKWAVRLTVPYAQITAEASLAMWRMIGIGAGLTLLALFLLWLASVQISNPIQKITAVAESAASGNLEGSVDIRSKDETGVLAKAFNQMMSSLREMLHNEQQQRQRLEMYVDQYVEHMGQLSAGNLSARVQVDSHENGTEMDDRLIMLGNQLNDTTISLEAMIQQIREASSNLSSASAEILAATTQQASGSSEQSAAITQTTSTVEEVKAITEQFINRSQEVATTAQRSAEVSKSGERVVHETVTSMDQIKTQVNSIAENILALSERTQQIGDIINTVGEIASQSNILALNAAVEAARAGEHGRGFAVVAAEVRNLAEQSRQATAQVRTILLDIQKAINTTVMVTEEGTKVVDRGVNQAEQAGRVIQQLAGVIDESALLATQMSAAGRQQTTGIEQISAAMQNIKLATMQGLASTRQTEKAAQNLNELAQQLNELVTSYR